MSGWDRDLSRLSSQDDERASQSLLFHRTWHRGAGTAEGVRRRRAARRHRRGGSAAIGVAGVCRTPRRSPHTTAAARGPDVGAISRAIRSGLRAVVAGRNRSSPPRRWRSSWCADGKRGDSLHATAQLGGGGEGIGAPSSLARSEGARGASAGLRARSQVGSGALRIRAGADDRARRRCGRRPSSAPASSRTRAGSCRAGRCGRRSTRVADDGGLGRALPGAVARARRARVGLDALAVEPGEEVARAAALVGRRAPGAGRHGALGRARSRGDRLPGHPRRRGAGAARDAGGAVDHDVEPIEPRRVCRRPQPLRG